MRTCSPCTRVSPPSAAMRMVCGSAKLASPLSRVTPRRSSRPCGTTRRSLESSALENSTEDLQRTVSQANNDLERLDTLLESATSVTNTVDSASQLAYLVFSNPVIKFIAFASGTGRAIRTFRRRP